MRVKMIQLRSTPAGHQRPEEVVDVTEDEAYDLVERHYAESVDFMPPRPARKPIIRETAVLTTIPETADLAKPRKP